MHDAPKRFNELEGDFKKSSIGEYANRGEAADQINQTASNAGERPIACIIQVPRNSPRKSRVRPCKYATVWLGRARRHWMLGLRSRLRRRDKGHCECCRSAKTRRKAW